MVVEHVKLTRSLDNSLNHTQCNGKDDVGKIKEEIKTDLHGSEWIRNITEIIKQKMEMGRTYS